MPHLTPSTFAVAPPAARTRFRLRKSTWTTLLLASLMATLGAMYSEPAKAAFINITVTGTILTASTGMGYTVGDTVSFTWQVRDFTPPPNVTLNPDNGAYIQENATEPVLWSGISGSGISGTYVPLSSGSQPFSRLQIGWSGVYSNLLSPKLGADVTIGPSLNQGLNLTADPTYWIDDLSFRAGLTGVAFGSITAPAPTPTAYLANYLGTYTAFTTNQFSSNEIKASNGTQVKTATFNPLSVEISSVQPVPEPSSLALLALGAGGLIALRRRQVA